MPVFPATRCPECGTTSTGRICPSCHYELWESVYRFLDPQGVESIVPWVGLSIGLRTDGRVTLGQNHGELDSDDFRFEPLCDGEPVMPMGRAWFRWDNHLVPEADMERGETPAAAPPGADPDPLDVRASILLTKWMREERDGCRDKIKLVDVARALGVHRDSLYDESACPSFRTLWSGYQAKQVNESRGRRRPLPRRVDDD